jgi:hypothetical protein
MLSGTFSLAHMSAYDVVSQMRFSKRDITTLASRMPWRETTALGQVHTARRRCVASPEETMAILLSRLSMPSRVEDLEQRFCRSKGAINEILYEMLECFIKWASPLVLEFQGNYLRSRVQLYARKTAAKSRNATQHCLGFIDSTCSSRTIVLDIRPLTVRELVISTANCHSCGEQNCKNLRTKTLMSTDCR